MMMDVRKKIAIIGTGIAGLGAAYLLSPHHDVTVYEKNDYVGGHARTRTIRYDEHTIAVDTGFIVFNHKNYPHLSALFHHLGVPVEKSAMSFGVKAEDDELEWGAENLNALFGQRRNLVRPAFYRFLLDVLRFNFTALRTARKNPTLTFGAFLQHMKMGDWFQRYYILPMGGSIWSCSLEAVLSFPAAFFVEFFDRHGLLSVLNQPQWYTVKGGSLIYINQLISSFAHKIKTSCAAVAVKRNGVTSVVSDTQGGEEAFDHVIFATHADETLAVLHDASDDEKSVLSAFRYQENTAVLHKHTGLMPKRKRCWASWIYHADRSPTAEPVGVTYWMNHLQNIDKKYPLFVTLNPRDAIPARDIFERHVFSHPVYNPAAVEAQARVPSLQGEKNTWFCGAYLRSGFHEDGLASAVNVARLMGISIPWQ